MWFYTIITKMLFSLLFQTLYLKCISKCYYTFLISIIDYNIIYIITSSIIVLLCLLSNYLEINLDLIENNSLFTKLISIKIHEVKKLIAWL